MSLPTSGCYVFVIVSARNCQFALLQPMNDLIISVAVHFI